MWNKITIAQYQSLDKARRGVYEFSFEREIAVISAVTGREVYELESLPKEELVALSHEVDFINNPLSEQLTTTFRIGFKRFNLLLQANKLTAEQFILLNKYTATEATVIENLHNIVAVLSTERKYFSSHSWDYKFDEKAELLKQLPIETVYASCVFFCKVYKSWLEATETYLITKAQELQAKAKSMKK